MKAACAEGRRGSSCFQSGFCSLLLPQHWRRRASRGQHWPASTAPPPPREPGGGQFELQPQALFPARAHVELQSTFHHHGARDRPVRYLFLKTDGSREPVVFRTGDLPQPRSPCATAPRGLKLKEAERLNPAREKSLSWQVSAHCDFSVNDYSAVEGLKGHVISTRAGHADT